MLKATKLCGGVQGHPWGVPQREPVVNTLSRGRGRRGAVWSYFNHCHIVTASLKQSRRKTRLWGSCVGLECNEHVCVSVCVARASGCSSSHRCVFWESRSELMSLALPAALPRLGAPSQKLPVSSRISHSDWQTAGTKLPGLSRGFFMPNLE